MSLRFYKTRYMKNKIDYTESGLKYAIEIGYCIDYITGGYNGRDILGCDDDIVEFYDFDWLDVCEFLTEIDLMFKTSYISFDISFNETHLPKITVRMLNDILIQKLK